MAYQGVRGVQHIVDDWTRDLPSLENTEAFNFAQDSHMYAADQTTMLAEFQLENRTPVVQSQVSDYVLRGTVDTEDVRFSEHNGVDLTGIMRALINNLAGGSLEGASTITQQLIRNTVLSQEATDISFERKIREAQLAIELEKKYSKDEILMLYLNTINYGNGCYGIEAAAQFYFQASARDLSLAQAATLIGIPQSPTYNEPVNNAQNCLKRRNLVLDRMLNAGDVSQEQHDAAQGEDLTLNLAPPRPKQGIYAYPYFTSYVRDLLLEHGDQYNLSDGDLFEGGYSIYTTLDTTMQDDAEAACAAQNDLLPDNLESSLVAIDPRNGYLKALVGGRDFFSSQWNIATQGKQPTGSAFKTFTLAAAIEKGVSPKTLIDCTNPLKIDGGEDLWNFGKYDYGIRSIESATTVSSNTGYYRLAEQVTPKAMNDMAQRLGAEFEPYDAPISTLGTENVTPLTMAKAYATLANGGVKHAAIAIAKIIDKNGNVVYEAPDKGQRVVTEEVAGAVTKVLRTVFESSAGTAYGQGPSNGQPVAGKTGTVQEFRGHWLVGYAPQLACAAWIGGRDYEQTDESLTANGLWKDFMTRALAGQEITQFPATKDPEYKNAFNNDQKKKYGDKGSDGKDPAKAPSMAGKTLRDAQSLLGGYVVYYVEEYSDAVPSGLIIRQGVQGSQLMLYVSKGPKPADTTPPPPNPNPVGPRPGT